jgi:hypothetical protein
VLPSRLELRVQTVGRALDGRVPVAAVLLRRNGLRGMILGCEKDPWLTNRAPGLLLLLSGVPSCPFRRPGTQT